MRRETKSERAAWTEHVTGAKPAKAPKYGNKRVEFNGRMYDSIREANHAAKLQPLAERGLIKHYEEQKRIVLIPGNGKLRPVTYIADFYYVDDSGTPHVVDVKGFKHPIYRLKKRMAALLLRIEIEEV